MPWICAVVLIWSTVGRVSSNLMLYLLAFLLFFVRVVDMFSLEIKVEAFPFIDSDGRKSYSKGKVIKWDVEVGALTLDLLLTSLSNEVKCGETQCATVWFFDKRIGEDVRLVDDVQMSDLFEMYKTEMHCQVIVTVLDKGLCDAHDLDHLEPICVVPPSPENPPAAKKPPDNPPVEDIRPATKIHHQSLIYLTMRKSMWV